MNRQLRLTEAAAELGLSYNVLYRALLLGRLKARRLEGHWWVESTDLERFVRARVRATVPRLAGR